MEGKEVDELYRGRQKWGGQEMESTMPMREKGEKMDNCVSMEGKEEEERRKRARK